MQVPTEYNNMYFHMKTHQNRENVSTFITPPPPPQDSPNHILNALNDKLLQRVLSYLIGDIRDFFNAAEVCKKFQENAKLCYPSIYKDFCMGRDQEDHLPLSRVENFLNIFGHLINSIEWGENQKNSSESEIFNAIADFCGNNLRRLRISNHNLDFILASKFKILEELELFACNLNNFRILPTLNKLLINDVTFNCLDWISKTYPNLKDVAFKIFRQLNDEILIEFHRMNPQLESFRVVACHFITSSIFQGIATRLPNLIALSFGFCFNWEDTSAEKQQFRKDVMDLSELKNLRRLRSIYPQCMSTCGIMEALADKNIPIEELIIDGLNPCVVESVARLKNIKNLHVHDFSYKMVIDLVSELPELKSLLISEGAKISLDGVKQILEKATNLKDLYVYDYEMIIDSDELIISLLDLIRDRVEVVLTVKETNVHIDIRTILTDSNWLMIYTC